MPYIKKKDIKELMIYPFMSDVLEDYGYDFHDNPPETWMDSDKELFDMMGDLQDNILNKIKELTNDKE